MLYQGVGWGVGCFFGVLDAVSGRGRKLINKLVINKLEKFKFFHVGKNNSHPRKNEKNREKPRKWT